MNEQRYFTPSKRSDFCNALPEQESVQGGTPSAKWIYLPATHRKALEPDRMLVQGIRGSGKTFWCTVLKNDALRKFYSKRIGLDESTRITVGFAEGISDVHPANSTLTKLMQDNYDAHGIWRTVCLVHVLRGLQKSAPVLELEGWKSKIDWVNDNDEAVNTLWLQADAQLSRKGVRHIILFDALDRTADSWEVKAKLMRGVLQTALEMRSTEKIRLKIFARPDQLNDPHVRSFTDASKLINQKTDLNWTCEDLYGLLWQHLANSESFGTLFREFAKKNISGVNFAEIQDIFLIPHILGSNVTYQQYLFYAIAGQWMGNNKRRGWSYSWMFNHLSDTLENVAPRTFLRALRAAAENTNDRLERRYILHPEDINVGVQKASIARTLEIEEEYRWVPIVLRPLEGELVPCDRKTIEKAWSKGNLKQRLNDDSDNVPSSIVMGDYANIIDMLVDLGIARVMKDNRINIPDVYRVGFGIGRYGGVKKVRRF